MFVCYCVCLFLRVHYCGIICQCLCILRVCDCMCLFACICACMFVNIFDCTFMCKKRDCFCLICIICVCVILLIPLCVFIYVCVVVYLCVWLCVCVSEGVCVRRPILKHKNKIYDFPFAIFVCTINYGFIPIFHPQCPNSTQIWTLLIRKNENEIERERERERERIDRQNERKKCFVTLYENGQESQQIIIN